MSATFPVPLAPNNLARPPIFWSAAEVKAWVEFCVQEFSLSPIAYDRFDMNGKALMLLTRSDFMERAPRAGDVLYNAFSHLRSSYTFNQSIKTPVFVATSRDLGARRDYTYPPPTALTSSPIAVHPTASSSPFIPILPHPIIPSKVHHPQSLGEEGDGGEKLRSEGTILDGVPVSILSPAATDKSFSDTESCHNYIGSPIKSKDSPPAGDKHYTTSASFFPSTTDLGPDDGDDRKEDVEITSGVAEQRGDCRLLWEFIYQLLTQDKKDDTVCWENAHDLVFRIHDPTGLANQWGSQKNRRNMTYEKLSRALRYYYKMNIIQKVPGKKLTYQFLQSPEKIRKGQRGARPHAIRSQLGSSSTEHSKGNNEFLTMENSGDPTTVERTHPSDGARNSFILVPSSKTSSTDIVPSPGQCSPSRGGNFKENEEVNELCSNRVPKQETLSDCFINIGALENPKSLASNKGDAQEIKYADIKQQTVEETDFDDHDIQFNSQGHKRKLPSLLLPSSSSSPSSSSISSSLSQSPCIPGEVMPVNALSKSPPPSKNEESDPHQESDVCMNESNPCTEFKLSGFCSTGTFDDTEPESNNFDKKMPLEGCPDNDDVEMSSLPPTIQFERSREREDNGRMSNSRLALQNSLASTSPSWKLALIQEGSVPVNLTSQSTSNSTSHSTSHNTSQSTSHNTSQSTSHSHNTSHCTSHSRSYITPPPKCAKTAGATQQDRTSPTSDRLDNFLDSSGDRHQTSTTVLCNCKTEDNATSLVSHNCKIGREGVAPNSPTPLSNTFQNHFIIQPHEEHHRHRSLVYEVQKQPPNHYNHQAHNHHQPHHNNDSPQTPRPTSPVTELDRDRKNSLKNTNAKNYENIKTNNLPFHKIPSYRHLNNRSSDQNHILERRAHHVNTIWDSTSNILSSPENYHTRRLTMSSPFSSSPSFAHSANFQLQTSEISLRNNLNISPIWNTRQNTQSDSSDLPEDLSMKKET